MLFKFLEVDLFLGTRGILANYHYQLPFLSAQGPGASSHVVVRTLWPLLLRELQPHGAFRTQCSSGPGGALHQNLRFRRLSNLPRRPQGRTELAFGHRFAEAKGVPANRKPGGRLPVTRSRLSCPSPSALSFLPFCLGSAVSQLTAPTMLPQPPTLPPRWHRTPESTPSSTQRKETTPRKTLNVSHGTELVLSCHSRAH